MVTVAPATGTAANVSCTAVSHSESDVREYLIQKVCVNEKDEAVAMDPCFCKEPHHLRSLKIGEPLPYHKMDQAAVQRHDSYPARTPGGEEIVVNPFDFTPFGVFNPWGDGYDIYQIKDGWASASFTKDGGGFGTTFFGGECRPYNGWIFFPATGLDVGDSEKQAALPISARYWEQNGEAWPGKCPTSYTTNSQTFWQIIRDFSFGGSGSSTLKKIDALRVVHGLSTDPSINLKSHLEIFYFTKLYGGTRWEVWVPDVKGAPASQTANCSGPDHFKYHNNDYVRTGCRDWTSVTVTSKPDQMIWPVPSLNLLTNFHFSDGVKHWNRVGESQSGNQTNWHLRNSKTSLDIKYIQPGGEGPRYLAINCGGKCTTSQGIYQDIDLDEHDGERKREGDGERHFAFGIDVRSESGTGSIKVLLQAIDHDGTFHDLGESMVDVKPNNERFNGEQSIVLSCTSLFGTARLARLDGAKLLRFKVTPLTGNTFDIVDTWLMRSD